MLAAVLLVLAVAGPVSAAGSAGRGAPKHMKAPKIGGSKRVGHSLSATRGTWTRHPTRFRYSWRRCDANGRRCAPVASAHSHSYRLASWDAGSRMRVIVTASN